MAKILIIDDDTDIRRGLNTRLRAAGYETTFAVDGVEAISAARHEEPDLILLDIGLPAGDGHVVLDRLRELPELSCTPVIVLSALDARKHERRARLGGAYAYFQKPADNDELLSTIEQAISKVGR